MPATGSYRPLSATALALVTVSRSGKIALLTQSSQSRWPVQQRSVYATMANETNVTLARTQRFARRARATQRAQGLRRFGSPGLSACGKSTVANLVDHKLHKQRPAQLRARRRQRAHGPERRARHAQGAARRRVLQAVRPGLLGPGPRREHPPHRRRGQAVSRGRAGHADRLHQPLSPRSRRRARHDEGRRLHRNLRRCPARSLRKARSQGAVQEGPRRRAEGLHRHRRSRTRPRTSRSWCWTPASKDAETLADEVIAYLTSAARFAQRALRPL